MVKERRESGRRLKECWHFGRLTSGRFERTGIYSTNNRLDRAHLGIKVFEKKREHKVRTG